MPEKNEEYNVWECWRSSKICMRHKSIRNCQSSFLIKSRLNSNGKYCRIMFKSINAKYLNFIDYQRQMNQSTELKIFYYLSYVKTVYL